MTVFMSSVPNQFPKKFFHSPKKIPPIEKKSLYQIFVIAFSQFIIIWVLNVF